MYENRKAKDSITKEIEDALLGTDDSQPSVVPSTSICTEESSTTSPTPTDPFNSF